MSVFAAYVKRVTHNTQFTCRFQDEGCSCVMMHAWEIKRIFSHSLFVKTKTLNNFLSDARQQHLTLLRTNYLGCSHKTSHYQYIC